MCEYDTLKEKELDEEMNEYNRICALRVYKPDQLKDLDVEELQEKLDLVKTNHLLTKEEVDLNVKAINGFLSPYTAQEEANRQFQESLADISDIGGYN